MTMSFNRKWFNPRRYIPRLDLIVRLKGVLGRTVGSNNRPSLSHGPSNSMEEWTSISAEPQESIDERIIRMPQIRMRPNPLEIFILLCGKAGYSVIPCWNRFTSAGQVHDLHIFYARNTSNFGSLNFLATQRKQT